MMQSCTFTPNTSKSRVLAETFDLDVFGVKVHDCIMEHSSCFNLDSVTAMRCKERSYMELPLMGILLWSSKCQRLDFLKCRISVTRNNIDLEFLNKVSYKY